MKNTALSSTVLELPAQMRHPFEVVEGHPFIMGKLEGREVRFIFDSGAQDLVLNTQRVDCPRVGASGGFRGVNGEASSYYTRIECLEFGAWKIRNVDAMASDLSHLEGEDGKPIHGLIGFRHLIGFDWMLDYPAGEIWLWKRVRDEELSIRLKVQVQYRYHLPCLEVRIDGRPYQFLLDTGAPYIVMDTRNRAAVENMLEDMQETEMVDVAGAGVNTEEGRLKAFSIQDLVVRDSTIRFHDLSGMRKRFGDFDGIIGYSLLAKHRTVVTWDRCGLLILND